MGIIECMVFAARDLRHKSRNTVRTVLCFFVLQFLVILWLLISIVLPRTQAEIRDNAAKKKYLESYIDIDVSGNMVAGSEGYKIRDLLVKKDYIGYDNPIYGNIDMVSYAGMEDRWSYLNCDWLELISQDKDSTVTYPASDTGGSELLTVISGESFFYSDKEYEDYVSIYKDWHDGAMICGSPKLEDSGLILSDKLMKTFIEDEDKWKDLIGKKVTIKSKDKVLIEDYTLSGILDHRFFSDDQGSDVSDLDYLIFIKCPPQDLVKYSVDYFRIVFHCKEDVNYVLVLNELSKAGLTDFTPSNEGVFSVYSEEVMKYAEIILNELVLSLGSVISIAILFYLATTIYIEKKSKSPYIGILKAMGMGNWKIFLITCFQQLVVSILAVIPSCAFSVLCFYFINKNMDLSVGICLEATVADYVLVSLISILSTVAAGILLYLPAVISYMKQSPVRLMEEY